MKRVVIESVGFINVSFLSKIWRTLKEPHLHRTVDMAVKRCRVAGHKEEDVRLQLGGDAAGVTKCLEVSHDIQRASLVDQPGIQSCRQVTH